FTQLGGWLKAFLPAGILNSLLTEGIIPGIGGILIFVPQIAILFAFISLLEESGYMARVVFLMDKIMRKFGLNGRSIVPMISGVACAIPAILATRSIDNWRERLSTIFVIPLISCSARLPVYTILIAMVIPGKHVLGILNLQGLTLMGLYFLGFGAAILSAWVIKIIFKNKEKSFLIMELPLYKIPRWKNVGITIWEKSRTFVTVAGKIIIAISIILWVLANYGPGNDYENAESIVRNRYKAGIIDHTAFNREVAAFRLENSYAGTLGKFIEPLIEPIGFDWKMGIAIISSFAAREIFVGTMATLYSLGGEEDNVVTLQERLKNEVNPNTGQPVYTLAVSFSLIIYYVFAMQCMSTLAVVLRETKSWKWPLLQLFYMSGLAYISSFIVYNLLA
ncbi:MAG TPA: ferrous iron transporter B, partial [Cyclobacteriaceae bacterium]|nr:ferrous iron transporter B [Cyclobacteriaceae bacterium]